MIFGRKEAQTPTVGQDVITNDEERIGDVAAVHDDHLEVTDGRVDRQVTWRIPREVISRVDDSGIHLSVSRVQALAKGWEHVTHAGG